MQFDTFSRRLGKRIVAIRRQRKLTQSELAREADLSLKYLSMIESGTNPSLRTIMKVCKALGTDLAAVMEEEGIGSMPGRKTSRMKGVQIDLPEDAQMKKLLSFIRGLDAADKRRALRLLKTTFAR